MAFAAGSGMETHMMIWEKTIKSFYAKIRASFQDYRVTLVGIVLTTLYTAILIALTNEYEVTVFDGPVFMAVSRALLYFCFGAVFAETVLTERKKGKVCALIAAAVIALPAAFGTDLDADMQIVHISGDVLAELTERFLYGYLLLLVIGTVYCSYKKSGIGFSEYALKVFSNLMKTCIVFWLLSFGVLFIIGIIDTLLLDSYSDLEICCEILIIGFYLAPMCIIAIRDMGNEPGAFLKTIVKYILMVLSACGMAIVYLYLIKIVILWEIPSNEVFSIVSALFCLGMPVWLMFAYYDDNARYFKMFSKLPYLFVPLICLQLYSMIVRIGQYGVTPGRYMGMALILFEIGALLIWRFLKEKRETMLLFLGALIVIAVFVPGINMYRVSNFCQQSFLKKYYQAVLDGKEISSLEYERLEGSYKYLKYQAQTKDIVTEYDIYEKDFMQMLDVQPEIDPHLTSYDTHSIHCCQLVGTLDVEDYQTMDMLNQADCYSEKTDEPIEVFYPNENGEKEVIFYGSGIPIDFSAFQFVKRATGETIMVDISEFAWKCMLYELEHPDADSTEISDMMRNDNCIQIDDNTVLYLNHFQIRYSEGIQYGEPYFEWYKPTISGMLLTKD